jgi:hypothetical protein
MAVSSRAGRSCDARRVGERREQRVLVTFSRSMPSTVSHGRRSASSESYLDVAELREVVEPPGDARRSEATR